MAKIGAPNLYYKVHCQKRVPFDDGMGNTVSDFATQFSVRAAFTHLRTGGEAVMASRLENKHPMIVTLRSSTQTRQINSDWQLVDARDNSVWAVRDVTPETDRQWISLLVEKGVAS
jgi:hypothetical protein